MWSTIDDRTICRFTSDAKDKPVSKYIYLQKINFGKKTTWFCMLLGISANLANHSKDVLFACQSGARSCDLSRHLCLCVCFQFHFVTLSLQIVILLFQRIPWCRSLGKDPGRLERLVKTAKQLAICGFISVLFMMLSLTRSVCGFQIKPGIVVQLYSLKSL